MIKTNIYMADTKFIFQFFRNEQSLGYCYSLNYGLDIIRAFILEKIEKPQVYQIVVAEDLMTVELYLVQSGYLYGQKLSLIDTFHLKKLPKLEVVRVNEQVSDNEDLDSDSESELGRLDLDENLQSEDEYAESFENTSSDSSEDEDSSDSEEDEDSSDSEEDEDSSDSESAEDSSDSDYQLDDELSQSENSDSSEDLEVIQA